MPAAKPLIARNEREARGIVGDGKIPDLQFLPVCAIEVDLLRCGATVRDLAVHTLVGRIVEIGR